MGAKKYYTDVKRTTSKQYKQYRAEKKRADSIRKKLIIQKALAGFLFTLSIFGMWISIDAWNCGEGGFIFLAAFAVMLFFEKEIWIII